MNWQRIKRVATNLEVIGLAVAVVFAWWHSREIVSVEHSLSTRPIGIFPDFVDDIQKTINSPKPAVIAACDFPGNGEYDQRGQRIQPPVRAKVGNRRAVYA